MFVVDLRLLVVCSGTVALFFVDCLAALCRPRHCHAGGRGPGVGPKSLAPITALPPRKFAQRLMGMGPARELQLPLAVS